MRPNRTSRSEGVRAILSLLFVAFIGTWLYAAPESVEDNEAATEQKTEQAKQQLYEKFAATLNRSTLIGNFTETGTGENQLTEERYEIESVEHLQGELWLFKARIRYAENDVTLPLSLPVRWAGDTPVICVDNIGFPGLGTYTARVMIYADHYAGFWSGGDHGGHLFGTIKRAKPRAE